MSSELPHSGTIHYSRQPGVDHFTTPIEDNGSDVAPTEAQKAPIKDGRNPNIPVQESLIPRIVGDDQHGKGVTPRKWHWKTMGTVFGFLIAGSSQEQTWKDTSDSS